MKWNWMKCHDSVADGKMNVECRMLPLERLEKKKAWAPFLRCVLTVLTWDIQITAITGVVVCWCTEVTGMLSVWMLLILLSQWRHLKLCKMSVRHRVPKLLPLVYWQKDHSLLSCFSFTEFWFEQLLESCSMFLRCAQVEVFHFLNLSSSCSCAGQVNFAQSLAPSSVSCKYNNSQAKYSHQCTVYSHVDVHAIIISVGR